MFSYFFIKAPISRNIITSLKQLQVLLDENLYKSKKVIILYAIYDVLENTLCIYIYIYDIIS